MRCLWLSGDVPYPCVSGRRTYSAGLTESLARAGVDVVGLGIDAGDGAAASPLVEWRAVAPAPGPGKVRKLASRWPSMADDRRTGPYRAALDSALDEPGWDVAVVDHLQMCWTLPLVRRLRVPVVYVSHNHESSARRDIANHVAWRNPMKGPLLLDARRSQRSERALVGGSALVTAITDVDASRFRGDGARRVHVLTPGYAGSIRAARTIDAGTPRTAVMVSNLEWHVKRANLLRLLAVADPVLADAGIELRIVGPAPSEFADALRARRAVRYVGPVASIDGQLDQARVGVICERDGGGFKLKALDYVFGRVPMAVLDGSMEGLPLSAGVDYASAATEEALSRAIVELVDSPAECQRMQSSAFDRCVSRFEWSSRGTDLAAALADITAGTGAR